MLQKEEAVAKQENRLSGSEVEIGGSQQNNMRGKRIDAVIFDLDGTLLDTERLSSEAMQLVLDRFGKQETWSLKEKILGRRAPEWGKIVVEEFQLEGKLDPRQLCQEWEENLSNLFMKITKMDGAEELTRFFHELGVPMGIATSSSAPAVAKKQICHQEMFGRMRKVITGDCVKSGKPAPDIYLATAEALGVDPRYCLAFEDALPGVESALSAGMHVVAVPDPRSSILHLFEKHASLVVPSLRGAKKSLMENGEYWFCSSSSK